MKRVDKSNQNGKPDKKDAYKVHKRVRTATDGKKDADNKTKTKYWIKK